MRIRRDDGSIVSLRIVCLSEQVIYACIVNLRQFNQYARRNVVFSCFILGIARLRHVEHFRHGKLLPVVILPKIAYALILHFVHPESIMG